MIILTSILLIGWSGQSRAANIPNFDMPVNFDVREQDINEFLNILFQEIDVPVLINTRLEGTVNGKFNNTARSVFDEISKGFSLTAYYDGAVVQLYRKNEISRKLLPTTGKIAVQVVATTRRMNLPDRSNTIVAEDNGVLVTGTEKFIEQVEDIISTTKTETRPRQTSKPKVTESPKVVSFPDESPIVYQLFKLKHAWATDTQFPVGGQTVVIPGVATILKELVHSGGVRQTLESVEQSSSLAGLRGKGLNQSEDRSKDKNQIASSVGENAPRIVADSRLNAIVIRDKQDKMASYRGLIESLDVESGMVEIEAAIIDINTDKSQALGVNWRYQGDNVDVLLGQGTSTDQSLIPGSGPVTTQGQGQGQGGILSFSLGEPAEFLARISALEQRGVAKIISKPHVITLSDVEAVLAATTEFFVRVAGDEEVDLFNVPVGTTLRVTPHIFRSKQQNKIKLLVNIEDGTQSADASVDNIPVVERSNISTQAVINEGDSLLVGGLVRETFRDSRDEVPVLGSIPLVGGLFRSNRKQVNRVERLFMITPRLASGIGFGRSEGYSALAGNRTAIINDAATRITSDDYPSRESINFWSAESLNEKKRDTLTSVVAEDSINTSKDIVLPRVFATIENDVFESPYKVERW